MGVILTVLMLLLSAGLVAQQEPLPDVDPSNPVFRALYQDTDLEGKFAKEVLQDSVNRYYLADLTLLPTRFDRVWFLYLVFEQEQVVNIDASIDDDRLWFLAHRSIPGDEALRTMEALLDQTLKASASLSEQERQEWLQVNDKYRIP